MVTSTRPPDEVLEELLFRDTVDLTVGKDGKIESVGEGRRPIEADGPRHHELIGHRGIVERFGLQIDQGAMDRARERVPVAARYFSTIGTAGDLKEKSAAALAAYAEAVRDYQYSGGDPSKGNYDRRKCNPLLAVQALQVAADHGILDLVHPEIKAAAASHARGEIMAILDSAHEYRYHHRPSFNGQEVGRRFVEARRILERAGGSGDLRLPSYGGQRINTVVEAEHVVIALLDARDAPPSKVANGYSPPGDPEIVIRNLFFIPSGENSRAFYSEVIAGLLTGIDFENILAAKGVSNPFEFHEFENRFESRRYRPELHEFEDRNIIRGGKPRKPIP